MPLPDDFESGPVQTLARVASPALPSAFGQFWKNWEDSVFAEHPRLVPRAVGGADPTDPGADHEFVSCRHVRIGCALLVPPKGRPSAGVVTTHGYRDVPSLIDAAARWRPLTERGAAVLIVRVRGFPGSCLDTGSLRASGWITHGLEQQTGTGGLGCEWSLCYGVADAVNACRALSFWLGAKGGRATAPVFLHGESFGGALAVIAAARLAARGGAARLAIGLPDLGDWEWRVAHPHGGLGTGAEIHAALTHFAHRREQILETLRLFDTAIHARDVRCPALCKLAQRDDQVPAPSAAAVFNALGADPGRKWRFVTAFGHHDGGIRDSRRHALFDRAVDDFLDPGQDPGAAMRRWHPLLWRGERAPDEPQAPALFPDGLDDSALDRRLIEAYERAGRTLDDLPYTAEFERLLGMLGPGRAARDVFHRLHNLRKAKRLPRLGAPASRPPRITAEEERLLAQMVVESVGSLGQRDRLPFSDEFSGLAESFNQRTGRSLDPHDVWRLVAKLAK